MYVPDLIKKEGIRRGLSPRTIKTYSSCVERFLKCYKNKDIKKITKKDVTDYIDKLLEKNVAGNTINVYLNSIKFLMENVLNKRLTYRIRYSKGSLSTAVIRDKLQKAN